MIKEQDMVFNGNDQMEDFWENSLENDKTSNLTDEQQIAGPGNIAIGEGPSDHMDEASDNFFEEGKDEGEFLDQREATWGGGPLGFIRSKLRKIHPAFLIAAVVATILIEWIMIVLQSYKDLPTLWVGLGIYLGVTLFSVILLTHMFKTRYRTLVSVLTVNSLLLTIPLGALISLITGYTISQLLSPNWIFTHDFVYIMIVNQLVVTTLLMLGIWWKTRGEEALDNRDIDEIKGHEPSGTKDEPSLIHNVDLQTKKELYRPEGFVNGLTNGQKQTFKDKRAPMGNMPNEQGIINGFTNGMDLGSRSFKNSRRADFLLARSDRKVRLKKAKQIAFPIILLLMIVGVLFLPYVHVPSSEYVADRNWRGVASYTDETDEIHSNSDMIEYSSTVDEYFLWARVKVKGEMLGNSPPDTNTVFIFLDADRDSRTGYSMGGLGSDFMIKVFGFDGKIRTSTISRFSESRESDDWNGWLDGKSAESSVEDDTLQIMVPLSRFDFKEVPLVYFGIIDTQGAQDYSAAPIDPKSGGLLIVEQRSDSPDILKRGDVDVLTLDLTARGGPIMVESIDITSNIGDIKPLSLPVYLERDETTTLNVSMDTRNINDGEFVEVKLDAASVVTDNGSVFVKGRSMKAYVGSAPSVIKIDGAFGDWVHGSSLPISEGSGESPNPNVDISEYHTARAEDDLFFFIGVNGTMMGGVKIPQLSSEKKEPTSQGASQNRVDLNRGLPPFIPKPELTGDDTAYVFIDTDSDINTGYRPVNPFTFPIGADYMIEIKGQGGVIKSSNYFRSDGNHNQWSWKKLGSVSSASDEKRLEIKINLSMLGIESPVFNAFIHVTDWNDNDDYSDRVIGEGPVRYHTSTGTRKNNGFPDGDIDTIDGGSCAGAFGCHDLDPTQIPISLSWDPPGPYNPGQTGINITVTVDMDGAASSSETGLAMRIGPSGGMPHYGIENDGWVIENDPHNNTNNFIMESNIVGQGPTDFVWTVTAPSTPGTYYVEASVQYDNGGGGQEYNITAESTVSVIPEFQDVLPPLLSILVIMVVGKRVRRGRM